MTKRRRADWSTFLGSEGPEPTMVAKPASSDLAPILAAFDEWLALDDSDAIVKRTVEIARERVGLTRVGIWLYDEPRGRMLGTWGTDLDGATVDEHFLMYDANEHSLELFRRAAEQGIYWLVVDNAPIVMHLPAATRVAGRAWVCCTPIRSARGLVGVMFNDAGLQGTPIDEAKQARAAVLASLVGTVLDLTRGMAERTPEPALVSSRHPMVIQAVQLLSNNPGLSGESLGAALGLSPSRLARVFKVEMEMSLVEYRNRLRLERFSVLLDKTGDNLLEAALQAGFGSYAQFHRVFRALRGATPRSYLRSRR